MSGQGRACYAVDRWPYETVTDTNMYSNGRVLSVSVRVVYVCFAQSGIVFERNTGRDKENFSPHSSVFKSRIISSAFISSSIEEVMFSVCFALWKIMKLWKKYWPDFNETWPLPKKNPLSFGADLTHGYTNNVLLSLILRDRAFGLGWINDTHLEVKTRILKFISNKTMMVIKTNCRHTAIPCQSTVTGTGNVCSGQMSNKKLLLWSMRGEWFSLVQPWL